VDAPFIIVGGMQRASRTAEQVALFRALETARGGDRIFTDPYAARFLGGGYRLAARLARLRPVGRGLARYIDGRWQGTHASAVARTRLIDDLVAGAVTAGCRQVLLLGAGYDSRAYRLPALAAARVFEADHPATQAVKRRLIDAHVPAAARAHVRFVPVDLITDDLGAALRPAGFAPAVPAVVIWEGVTNYLTEAAVDATLRGLAALTGPGSRVIFTYVDRAVLDDGGSTIAWQAAVRRQGEPWTFGFDPAAVPGYLNVRGLRLRLDLSTADAAARYLAPLGRTEQAATFYRIAEAEKPGAQVR
jgi:methyltransferase (TIGR00027 family)